MKLFVLCCIACIAGASASVAVTVPVAQNTTLRSLHKPICAAVSGRASQHCKPAHRLQAAARH